MKKISAYRRKIAVSLLMLMATELCLPAVGFALTSGPAQPEARSFQPAGLSDMVDLFTGSFKYNIPLLDVDGYPVNLNYESGTGMDDEASWVGLGWNVNVGAITRQLRGIPDDMSGDTIVANNYTKPKVTIGARVTGKFELFQNGTLLHGSGSFGLGIFSDNYTGIGADITANAGVSFTFANESPFTASLGIGVNSSTASGVDLTPTVNLGISRTISDKVSATASLSASLGYNSRSGLKNLTLGSSFDISKIATDSKKAEQPVSGGLSGSFISFNTEPISPDIQIPYQSSYGSFSLDIGLAEQGFFTSIGGTGYKNVRSVAQQQLQNPAYGFLYAERGKNQKNAIMDFTREKENPVIPSLPDLAVPVTTPDIFSYTSQVGSGQFRLHRGGSGAYFDNEVSDKNGVTTAGIDLGVGFTSPYFNHGGITYFRQSGSNTTRKWVSNNDYLSKGDFQDVSYTNPNSQQAYFKVVGEKTSEDFAMTTQLHDTQPLEVSISGQTANASFTNNSLTNLQKLHRSVNQTEISYLTASEAALGGLDKKIKNYPFYTYNPAVKFAPPLNNITVPVDSFTRVDTYHKPHHLSEITVTNESGKRLVYGLPVYSVNQTEYSFAIGAGGTDYNLIPGTNNLVPVPLSGPTTINSHHGIDQYYHAQSQPAYASSFLLTAILSPDYVDKTGDGISDDDLGTALKFNYSRLTNSFKWRSPFNGATLNRGLLADRDDDKASIVYGEKEIWYISTIESKTKIAYFITQNRNDALGVTNFTGSRADAGNQQKCLEEIRLYSKADMTKPIKVVKFEYSYELCRGVPNNLDNLTKGMTSDTTKGGKLTLKKVFFEYANSPKGANYPYVFTYQNNVNGQAVNYGDMLTDRWGVYKTPDQNLNALKNDEFPYTPQDIQGADTTIAMRVGKSASLWHLSTIGLPTGGIINMGYESDDYAYVQDKRAMAMSGMASLIDAGGNDVDSTRLDLAKGIRVQIPDITVTGDPTSWFKRNYMNGADYIYTKFSVKMSTPNSYSGGLDYDFLPCYCFVQSVTISNGYAYIIFQDRSDGGITANPVIFSAWQCMKEVYPRYAYPGFDQRAGDSQTSSAVSTAVKAILSSIGNLSELSENFYHKAARQQYARQVQLSKCFVKLIKQNGHKLGGGVRVKKIQISDSWQSMAGNNLQQNANYGQAYDYTTIDNGQRISSGVAAYEPSVGNDENALKQPIPYIQKVRGAVDNFFDLEAPFGESYFPAPTVGYGKVTVTDLDKNGQPDPTLRTGYSVDEFYTAKDFPVQLGGIPLTPIPNKPTNYFSFVAATSVDELTMSQGYSIILNDMHGKQKATRIFNQSGSEIASTLYEYNADQKGADEYTLNNAVNVVNPDGVISTNQVIGRDIDFFTDFREFESKNSGRSIQVGFDFVGFCFFCLSIPGLPTYDNTEYKLFRSACAVKVVQNYGILSKVIKTENGSTITTENLAYDGVTGEPVVTSTQNEFDNNIYSTKIPAYWAYKGMGPAYQNSGTLFQNFTTNKVGEIQNYQDYLQAGDEIVDLSTGIKYWVINDQAWGATQSTFKLVSRIGKYVSSLVAQGLVKLVRSGYRNMLSPTTQSVVSLVNPIRKGQLQFISAGDLTSLKVINASVTTYNESWAMNQNGMPADSIQVGIDTVGSYGMTLPLPSPLPPDGDRGSKGVYIFGNGSGPGDTIVSNFYLQNELNNIGIWPTPTSQPLLNIPVDIETDFVLAPGTYYFGYSGDGNNWNYYVDGVSLPGRPWYFWNLYQVTLTSTTNGNKHHLSLIETNSSDLGNFPGAIGLEIYSGTLNQIIHDDFNRLYSTLSLLDSVVTKPLYRKFVNPYVRGFLGNWREHGSNVFQQSRNYTTNPTVKGVNVKNAGYINNFSSYWYYGTLPNGTPGWVTDQAGNRSRWVQANTVTSYDVYGQQLENKDALGKYSAALFNFNGELPGAVASNAMNREIYSGTFEDFFFTPGTGNTIDQPNDFKQPVTNLNIRNFVDTTSSHSGNYCVKLPGSGLNLTTNIYNKTLGMDTLLSIDQYGEYNLKTDTGLYPNGFEPSPGKSYIFDVWVKDGRDTDKSVNLGLTLNGSPVTLTCKALVEGWKLLEGQVDLTNLQPGSITLAMTPLVDNILIDDLRIHPFDSQMKTYAYDDKTMRLMAEIDENGFATFYEYDDEGLLIRVKKETERGIMTIKESRSSYKKGS